ncbi:MAG: ABC transporter ATP-binding protein [Clostridia bacterium]|nr:ABC transporter ATP-binding protein [Clostridia bacterium]
MRKLIGMNLPWFIGTFVCVAGSVLLDYLSPLLLAETLDHYLAGEPSVLPGFLQGWLNGLASRETIVQNLWIVGLLIIGINLLSGVFNFLKGRWSAEAGENVALYLRESLYDHIQRLPFSYHMKAETGDLVQRCTSDVETVRRFLSVQLMQVANAVIMIVVALSVLLTKNIRLTLLSMILIPPLFLFAWLFFRWVVKAFREADEAEGKMSAVLQENLTGVRVVRAFGRQAFEIDKFGAVNDDFCDKNFKINKLLAIYWSVGDCLSMLQSMITLVACIYAAISGEITLGVLVIYTTYVGKLLFPIRQLGRILSDAGKSMVALDRIGQVLNEPEEPEEPGALRPNLRGDIVFDDVVFRYDDEHPVLDHISFTVRQGETVALLGATGSGKSSVALLLQRLFEPQGGTISIAGTPISQIDRSYLRGRIGLVLQEPFLYSRTIRENVAIADPKADDGRIDRAVTDAAAKPFILDSENGFDTVVGERGVTLSGGQKQRLAIARTLVRDNDILIFDDSLSAVDTETDAMIRRALKERREGVTTVIISHRINTLREADQILVLENGKISEQGTHEQLIRQPGLYQQVFRIQTSLETELAEEGA